MKRSVILTLCIVLCLALTLGGTIAYLSDFDGDVNVMTLGQVKIEIMESQRSSESSELVDYQDGKPLYPIVGDISQRDTTFGLPTNPLFVDKIVQVNSNARNAKAYLRIYIGVPTAVLDVGHTGENAVHLLWGKDTRLASDWPWEEAAAYHQEVVIDGIDYTMLCYNYIPLLEPDETTVPLLAGLYLDQRVDNGDNPDGGYTMWIEGKEYPILCDLSQGLQVTVLALAVQADGFDTAAQAFRESGMDDVDFDTELNLKITAQLEAAVQKLVDLLNNRLTEGLDPHEPLTADLASETYTIDAAAAAALNDIAVQTSSDSQVNLLVNPGESVTINLTDAPLANNIGIINDGGALTITGPDATE